MRPSPLCFAIITLFFAWGASVTPAAAADPANDLQTPIPDTLTRRELTLLPTTEREFEWSLVRAAATTGTDAIDGAFRRRGLEMIRVEAKAADDKSEGGGGADLAKAAQNPIANMISLPFQDNIGFGMGRHGRTSNTLNIQPVVPVSLGKKWTLISRAILPVVYQPDITAANGGWGTGLGDLSYTAFLVPPPKGKLMFGAGPILMFPTATDEHLGSDTYGVGPSAVVVFSPGKWTLGCLVNNVWSFAGEEVNSFLVQPFINYNLRNQWYLVTAPIFTANWKADPGNRWLAPFGGGIGKIFKIGAQPFNASIQAYYDVWRPDGAPQWQARVQIQLLFPE